MNGIKFHSDIHWPIQNRVIKRVRGKRVLPGPLEMDGMGDKECPYFKKSPGSTCSFNGNINNHLCARHFVVVLCAFYNVIIPTPIMSV